MVLANAWGRVNAAAMLCIIGVRLEVTGQEYLRGPAIFVMNHTSFLDILVSLSLVPLRTSAIAKQAMLLSPFGPIIWLSGCFLVDRSNHGRALAIWRAAHGEEHPKVGVSHNNMAMVYRSQGKYDEAEALYRRELKGKEEAYGPAHPETLGTVDTPAIAAHSVERQSE